MIAAVVDLPFSDTHMCLTHYAFPVCLEWISDFKFPPGIKFSGKTTDLPKLFPLLVNDFYGEWKYITVIDQPKLSFRQVFPVLERKIATSESGTNLHLSHTESSEEGSLGLFLLAAFSAVYCVGDDKQKMQLIKAMKYLKSTALLDGFYTVGVLTFGTSSDEVCVIPFCELFILFSTTDVTFTQFTGSPEIVLLFASREESEVLS